MASKAKSDSSASESSRSAGSRPTSRSAASGGAFAERAADDYAAAETASEDRAPAESAASDPAPAEIASTSHAAEDRAPAETASEDRAARIVSRMYNGDAFSQWLGIQVVEVAPGRAVLQMTVRPEMTNGFKIAHGGISYSLADSALAFASNGYGRQALSIDTSIQHLKPVEIGQVLVAEAVEDHISNRLGHYRVRIVRADRPDEPIALFKGIVYRTEKTWEHE